MPRPLRSESALALACLALACRATHEVEGGPSYREARRAEEAARAPAPDEAARGAALAEVARLLEADALEDAHAALGALLVERSCAAARAALAGGRPEDALNAIDRALSLAPRDEDALLLKAHGSLALAEKAIAAGGPGSLVSGSLDDARAYFARSPRTPLALLGASRAASLSGDARAALELAREADAALAREPLPGELPWIPERVLAESAFAAYVEAKRAADPAAPELAASAEDALERLLGRTPADPWAWSTLSDLAEWEERLDDARAALERGLDREPADAGLLERLARVCRKAGGSAAAVAALDARAARDPGSALVRWYAALERFELATAGLLERFAAEGAPPGSNEDLAAGYARAEEEFRRAREAEPAYEDACRGYEVMCRAGAGWAAYQDERLEQAETAFLSMDAVVPRGLEWKIEGRILSGVDGLHLVGTRYNDREDWASAARVYDELHAYQPEVAVWANNAGFFHRDAAVALEQRARRLCAAAHGEPADAELLAQSGLGPDASPAALAARADALAEDARAGMQESWRAYRDAARLAPDDVRIVNDAALVLVYYLHTDIDEAERMLRRCVALGEAQLADPALEDDARWELKNAWGDAWQNLGLLCAVYRDDPEQARACFERSAAIGPEPRPVLSNFWIPFLRGELADDGSAYDLYAPRTWALPCRP